MNTLHYGSIGNLQLYTPYFIPHTEPSVSPPEFSIICRTHGGPATTVRWEPNGTTLLMKEYHDYEFSQIIVNSSHIELVYENREADIMGPIIVQFRTMSTGIIPL